MFQLYRLEPLWHPHEYPSNMWSDKYPLTLWQCMGAKINVTVKWNDRTSFVACELHKLSSQTNSSQIPSTVKQFLEIIFCSMVCWRHHTLLSIGDGWHFQTFTACKDHYKHKVHTISTYANCISQVNPLAIIFTIKLIKPNISYASYLFRTKHEPFQRVINHQPWQSHSPHALK
jgi:hypothetical protein